MKDSCSSVSTLLEKYFDREVTEAERSLVENHIRDCSTCRDVLASMDGLRTLMKTPVEEAVRREDFPWVWEKIERGIRLQERQTWWQSFRSWLDVTPLLRKKVWIPAAATFVVLLFITAQIIFKQTPSSKGASVVEYLESPTYNVMVYQLEEPEVTVIWMFEGPEEEHTST